MEVLVVWLLIAAPFVVLAGLLQLVGVICDWLADLLEPPARPTPAPAAPPPPVVSTVTAPPPVSLPIGEPCRRRRRKKPKPRLYARPTPAEYEPGVLSLADLRFHADECAEGMVELMRREGLVTSSTREAGLKEASDEEQLAYAVRTRSVLVTFDEGFFRRMARDGRHCGVVFVPGGPNYANYLEALRLCLTIARDYRRQPAPA